jgi:phospholipase/carboxylesterase
MEFTPLKYKFIAAEKISARPTVILLHGNDGTENDLLPLATWFGSDINILSVRGNVKAEGSTNFFDREKGDEELNFRTNELVFFLDNFINENKINKNKIIALGFSNGADIINYSLCLFPDFFTSVILMRTQSFLHCNKTFKSENKTAVLITNGKDDSSVKEKDILDWIELLKQNNFNVTHAFLDEGHNLSQKDIDMAAKWIARKN